MWEGRRSYGATLYSLSKDLVFVDCPLLIFRRRLGLSFFGERFDPWLDSSHFKEKETNLWRATPLYLLWVICKERNNVVFNDDQFSFD